MYQGFYDGLAHATADSLLPAGADWATRERERTRRSVGYHFADPLAPIILNRTAADPQLTELEAAYVNAMIELAAELLWGLIATTLKIG